MKKEVKFKGSIYLKACDNSILDSLSYEVKDRELGLSERMMNSFNRFNFSNKEKQKLSMKHRKDLGQFLNINVFELKQYSDELVYLINNSSEESFCLEAFDYGAYICLAAVYSGKIHASKKLVINLNNSPMALFPTTLIKKSIDKKHKINYQVENNFWINEFDTLHQNKSINFSLKKAA